MDEPPPPPPNNYSPPPPPPNNDSPPPPPPDAPPVSTTINISSSPSEYFDMTKISPMVLGIVILVIVGYGFALSSLGEKTEADNGGDLLHFELLLWGVFVLLILLNGMSYIFNIDITATLTDILTETPDVIVELEGGGGLTPKNREQVFHIPNNLYTYENAKAVCKAYGARLANIEDIDKAYEKGADWCSYGWSENQMALFPTQRDKWDELQKVDGHENDCGRPGINGGYIENPDVRFGINCFGVKPEITPEEAQEMAETPIYPETEEEKEFDKRVDFWSKRINDIMVAPFNSDSWNMV